MWMFCRDGFFSAVENRKNKQQVIVRARTLDDIKRLSRALRISWVASESYADYPYRLVCAKSVWGGYLVETAVAIDYDNFKNGMAKRFDTARMDQLHEVWGVMQEPRREDTPDFVRKFVSGYRSYERG